MLMFQVDAIDPDPRAIVEAVRVLREGGVVAYPTDTLYGLAVDPRIDAAVEKLFSLKGRRQDQPVPLIAADFDQATQAGSFGELERRLAARFWPGPLTLVVPAAPWLSSRLLAGGGTVAIRVPAHAVARALAAGAGSPITATSANASGGRPAISADEVAAAVAADVVLDGGPTAGGAPSTIVAIERTGPRLVRHGAIAWERVLESLQ